MFKDRTDAGQKLAAALKMHEKNPHALVLGLARGGVVIAAAVGKALEIPFDLIMIRKIGAPFNPELAIGAITETGKGYFNEELIHSLNVPQSYIDETIASEKIMAEKRLDLYRKNRPAPLLKDKTVILVDDGIATGATMMAAVRSSRAQNPKAIIVATPVAPPDSLEFLDPAVDQIICLHATRDFMAVSQFYEDFPQTEDDEIISLLQK